MVVSESGETLPGAFIILQEGKFNAISDDLGKFLFPGLCPGVYEISVQYFGYKSLQFLQEPSIEHAVLRLSATLGVGSLLPSYFRHHRKFTAIYILLVGFIVIGLSRFVDQGITEGILTATGALIVSSAHVVNFSLCKKYHKG